MCSGCGCARTGPDRFLLCVLQRVVVHVCVVLFVSCFSGCRSQCNDCMIVVVLCCHVRREMRVWILMLQNALSWLHGCCMGFVLGESRVRKPCVFPCKVAPAGDERYLVCAAGAAALEPVRIGSSSLCSATSGCSCVRSSIRFLILWLQIAV